MSACITGPRSRFIRGTARIKDMDTETAVKDPALMAFQSKVEATLNPALAADQTEVTITMTDGATPCLPDRARHRQQTQPDVQCRSGTEVLRASPSRSSAPPARGNDRVDMGCGRACPMPANWRERPHDRRDVRLHRHRRRLGGLRRWPRGCRRTADTACCCWRPAAGQQSLDPHPARLCPDLRQSEGELEVRDRSRSRN